MAPHEVVFFLELVRQARAAGRLVVRGTRDKNIQTLASLGLTQSAVLDAVAALEPESALGPPRKNEHPLFADELVCEFGMDRGSFELYVKVTAGIDADGSKGCVISFHVAERPMRYPFKS